MRTARIDVMAFGLMATMLSLSGCGKNASGLGARHAKHFSSADPAIKSAWDSALAAIATNGYVAASQSFKLVLAGNLTPDQVKAVTETATALSDQMYFEANKGDANAIAAIKELGKTRGR